MWGERTKARAARVLVGLFADHAESERVLAYLGRLQHVRALFDEGATALWHLAAMPSRHDVRVLARRVATLRRRVSELEAVLARLEAEAEARRGGEAEAATTTRDDATP